MILFFLLINVDTRIDSLEDAIAQNRQIETLVELNTCYIAKGEYHKGMELLKKHERLFTKDVEKARIIYETGNVYMFAGDIVKAHDMFLRVVGTYAKLDIANDAADRLYLIAAARDDTVQLKRLVNVVRLFETEQYPAAIDSARKLLKTEVGTFAYYYLALVYDAMGDVPLALGTLVEMNKKYPVHSVYDAVLLEADIYIRLDRKKNAQEILENLIVLQPNTIYALRARQRLQDMNLNSQKQQ
jgi:tetratricopeptide (TPR) repeat protein